tara:strand:+ start:6315 stop:6485 length:171 start_codon:yes stop_codon:yes gene_type:complete
VLFWESDVGTTDVLKNPLGYIDLVPIVSEILTVSPYILRKAAACAARSVVLTGKSL